MACRSSGDAIPNCLGELGEIMERTDGGFARTGRFSVFATCPVVILPRQESFASLHILTRRASEGSEALPSLARRVRMSFFGARVILAHSQTIADQGEKNIRHSEFHSSRRASPTASTPWPLLKIHSGPLQPGPEWGGILKPGGADPGPERGIRPRLFRAPVG